MRYLNIVGIFCLTISGPPHVADHIACLNHAAFLQGLVIRIVFPQMGVIIIPFFLFAIFDTPIFPDQIYFLQYLFYLPAVLLRLYEILFMKNHCITEDSFLQNQIMTILHLANFSYTRYY